MTRETLQEFLDRKRNPKWKIPPLSRLWAINRRRKR